MDIIFSFYGLYLDMTILISISSILTCSDVYILLKVKLASYRLVSSVTKNLPIRFSSLDNSRLTNLV